MGKFTKFESFSARKRSFVINIKLNAIVFKFILSNLISIVCEDIV
jgi:hypothetical protein